MVAVSVQQDNRRLLQPGDMPLPLATPNVSPSEPTVIPEPVAAATPTSLPSEPQETTFQASDGQTLTGLYYPAAVDSAPVAVLMHWVRGSQSEMKLRCDFFATDYTDFTDKICVNL